MHKLTIDWYRQVAITADTSLASKRWAVADAISKKMTKSRVSELVRLFCFGARDSSQAKKLTDELIAIDGEFPVANNTQELRLLAGLAMVAAFVKPSHQADALSLGLRSVKFPPLQAQPVQPEILSEAESYLSSEAARMRPDDFSRDTSTEVSKSLLSKKKVLEEADAAGDEAKKASARKEFYDSISASLIQSHKMLSNSMNQLAEESALLWWVLNEHSDLLEDSLAQLTAVDFALPAAIEVAARTTIVPPPPSINPLLVRALRACKQPQEATTLVDFVPTQGEAWVGDFLKTNDFAVCRELTPFCWMIEKSEELGDATQAIAVVSKLHGGLRPDLALTPQQAAIQFFNEIAFVRSLSNLTG